MSFFRERKERRKKGRKMNDVRKGRDREGQVIPWVNGGDEGRSHMACQAVVGYKAITCVVGQCATETVEPKWKRADTVYTFYGA